VLEPFAEPENRMALVAPSMIVGMAYKKTYRYGVSSILEANENISPYQMGYVMHIALKDIITLKTSQFFESGYFNYLYKTHAKMEDFKLKPQAIGPQVLTLDHLGAGFVVILVCLGLSSAAFAVECAPILWRKLKKLIGSSFACYAVVKFIRMIKMF
jgi:hypothetical protein